MECKYIVAKSKALSSELPAKGPLAAPPSATGKRYTVGQVLGFRVVGVGYWVLGVEMG